jgi:hypothetical protein
MLPSIAGMAGVYLLSQLLSSEMGSGEYFLFFLSWPGTTILPISVLLF